MGGGVLMTKLHSIIENDFLQKRKRLQKTGNQWREGIGKGRGKGSATHFFVSMM